MDSGTAALIGGVIAAVFTALGSFIPSILRAFGVKQDADIKRLAAGWQMLFDERDKEIKRLSEDVVEIGKELVQVRKAERHCSRCYERAAQWIRSAQRGLKDAKIPFDPFIEPRVDSDAQPGSDVHLALTDPPSSEHKE